MAIGTQKGDWVSIKMDVSHVSCEHTTGYDGPSDFLSAALPLWAQLVTIETTVFFLHSILIEANL